MGSGQTTGNGFGQPSIAFFDRLNQRQAANLKKYWTDAP
jgi:hypothetical protein